MFTHIVLFKLQEPNEANLRKVREIFESMNGNIPQLRYLEVGLDMLKSERSYDIALITRFDSLVEMQQYQVHPFHVNEVLTKLKSMVKGSITVDY